MFVRTLIAIACAAGIAGCTSYSGPTHNTDVVTLANGAQAYRVQCLGLLGTRSFESMVEAGLRLTVVICGLQQQQRTFEAIELGLVKTLASSVCAC